MSIDDRGSRNANRFVGLEDQFIDSRRGPGRSRRGVTMDIEGWFVRRKIAFAAGKVTRAHLPKTEILIAAGSEFIYLRVAE